MRRVTALSLAGAACALAVLVFALNYFSVQRVASSVLGSDPRNSGLGVSAHYVYWLDPDSIVFDLTTVSGTNSEADVARTLFQFAERMKARKFDRVYLAYKGHAKFYLNGDYFQELGTQFAYENPMFLLRTFPEHVKRLNGDSAFGTWTGGLLAVAGKQMDDFNQFHREWYLDDLVAAAR